MLQKHIELTVWAPSDIVNIYARTNYMKQRSWQSLTYKKKAYCAGTKLLFLHSKDGGALPEKAEKTGVDFEAI